MIMSRDAKSYQLNWPVSQLKSMHNYCNCYMQHKNNDECKGHGISLWLHLW